MQFHSAFSASQPPSQDSTLKLLVWFLLQAYEHYNPCVCQSSLIDVLVMCVTLLIKAESMREVPASEYEGNLLTWRQTAQIAK